MTRQLGPPPVATSPAVSRSMRGNVPKNTQPEIRLRQQLWAAGLRGYRLHWRKAPGRPDIAFPGRRLAVFVNGCFWHRCPNCQPAVPRSHSDFWARKFELNQERDARKQRELEQAGWRVITAWECELHDSPARAVDEIRAALNADCRLAGGAGKVHTETHTREARA